MSNFLYFIPVKSTKDIPAYLSENGLDYFDYQFDKFVFTSCNIKGKKGFIIQRDGTPFSARYIENEQKWLKIPKTEAMCGYWLNEPPTPDALKRDKIIEGVYVPITLKDGNKWTIPTARVNCDNETTGMLKRQMTFDDEGKIVPGDFADNGEKANKIAADLTNKLVESWNNSDVKFEYDDSLPIQILSINYRVSATEVLLLNLWDYQGQEGGHIIFEFVDYIGFLELKKKELSGV